MTMTFTTLKLQLQMNLHPGVYRIETAVFSDALGEVVSKGPSVNVQVSSSFRFAGTAQLTPRLEIGPGAP